MKEKTPLSPATNDAPLMVRWNERNDDPTDHLWEEAPSAVRDLFNDASLNDDEDMGAF